MAKVHKITSYFYDKRKILNQKFWSHGTPLGSMGPGSQQDPDEIFSQSQILVIWGLYNCPDIVACREQAKKPNLASSLVCIAGVAMTLVALARASVKFQFAINLQN